MTKNQTEPKRPWVIEFTTGHAVGIVISLWFAGWWIRYPIALYFPCFLISLVTTFFILKDAIHRDYKHKRKFTTSRGGPRNAISTKPRGFPKRSNHSITIYPPKDD